MKNLLWIILGVMVVAIIYVSVDFSEISLALPAEADELAAYDGTDDGESGNNDSFQDIVNEVLEMEDEYCYPVMIVGGKIIGWGGDSYPADLMFDGKALSNDPLLRLDSISPVLCELDLITRREKFDLSAKGVTSRIRDFLKPLDGFSRFQKRYVAHLDSIITEDHELLRQNTVYTFTLDYPNEGFPRREPLLRWLCDMISVAQSIDVEVPAYTALYIGYNRSKYKGRIYTGDATDISRLAEFATDKAFADWRDEYPSLFDISIVTDYRAHIVNDRYVTYGAFVHSSQEPGHGMYTENFYTLDLDSNKMVNNDYLFKEGSLDKVKKLLFAEMAKNKSYQPFNQEVSTAEDVEECINAWNSDRDTETPWEFVLPEGALTNEGVVFSFQPYQIACFAAGAFHFVVPYSKLQPYLTFRAKNLIKPQ